MRIVFIGNVQFSLSALRQIVTIGGNVVGVCTKKNSAFNTDFVDLSDYANKNNIDSCYVDDINSNEVYAWIFQKNPDIIFCFGWSQLLKERLLRLPPLGVLGYHPAALPANKGRHPIIWALVLGLDKTASTFFYIDDGIDSGDIISQAEVIIDAGDDADTLYRKITSVALQQIIKFFPALIAGEITRIPQDKLMQNTWRKRVYLDGQIDWRMSAKSIYNLVRGLTKPYAGAHFIFNGQEIKVWKVCVMQSDKWNLEPGKIIATVDGAPVVKCGVDSICLLDVEPKIVIKLGAYL